MSEAIRFHHEALRREQDYAARTNAWLEANGYRPNPKPIHSRGGDVGALLDHGFIAQHIDTGRSVLFGDPYGHALGAVEPVEQRYGLTIRRHPGLWFKGTTLLELWVDDPVKAVEMFRPGLAGRNSVNAPVTVGQPARFLGVTLGELRGAAAKRAAEELEAVF